jgi:hypothetical protein
MCVITVTIVILLRYMKPDGLIFITECSILQIFPSFLMGSLLVFEMKAINPNTISGLLVVACTMFCTS